MDKMEYLRKIFAHTKDKAFDNFYKNKWGNIYE